LAIGVDGLSVLTGGADGKVTRCLHECVDEIADFNGAHVRSVCEGVRGLLVGTGKSEIWEVSGKLAGLSNRKILLSENHFAGELWGLATSPNGQFFATCGDDKTLRIWDYKLRKMVSCRQMKSLMRSVAYSPDGSLLAVGFGGHSPGTDADADEHEGSFVVLDAVSLTVLHEGQDSKEWIQDMKFSPTGKLLAVSSHDNKIYLYDVENKYCLKTAPCIGHSSYVTHIDFTEDGTAMQSSCGAYELLYWDCISGSQKPGGADELKDAQWASWTCPLGWPVQGIWPMHADGTEINAVDRTASGRLIATVDNFGKVKLFNFPTFYEGLQFNEYCGHVSNLTNCRWTAGDSHLITTGGHDRSVFQWKIEGL
jgi:microtubule-associated protein-like 6